MKVIRISGIILLLLTTINQSIFAKNVIKGRVIDKTNNEVLAFANVYLPNYDKGKLTDKNGYYILTNLPDGKLKIQFSYVGYKTIIKTIITKNNEITLNIAMQPEVFQSDEIVVSGGTYSSQHENAIKIDLIKNKDLSAIGTPTFIKAIAQIPGIDMISKGTGVAKPVIRGLSMTNILMLNNGIKMENFQFSKDHPYIIDEFGIDHIEVIKGPASLLYGSDAVGGVINVIKEKPAPGGKIIGDYNMQYFSNTQGYVSNLGVKGSTESFFWGIRGGLKSHTDYKDGNNKYIPNTRFNENSFKVNIGLSKSFGIFRLFYDYNRPKLGMCVSNAIPLIKRKARTNNFWYQDLTSQIISTKNTLSIKNYKIDINGAYQINNRKLQTDNSTPQFDMVDMQLNTLSYEIKTHLPSTENSDYTVGLQGANKINNNGNAPNHIIPNAEINDFSVFALTQYVLFSKLKTQAGIRYDFRSIATDSEPNKIAINKTYKNISASIGATYQLNNIILFRTNLASAYRTPNVAELTENGMHSNRFEEGNSNLKSQRSYEGDLSAHYHSKNIVVDISGFYNKINNYIFMAPTNDTIPEGNTIYRYSQINSNIYGSELIVNVLPFNWLTINTNYAYLIGKQSNGDNLPFIPQNKLRVEHNFHKQKTAIFKNSFVKIGGLLASKQNKPAMFETETNGYFILNTGIGTSIKMVNQTIKLSIQANNLLNNTYYDHLSTLKDMNYYNIGRNISVTLKVLFGIK